MQTSSSRRWAGPLAVILAIAAVVGGLFFLLREDPNDPRVAFAQCLADKSVKMYGAYWCPHCQDQKRLFGRSFKRVPYVECGVPGNTASQTQACQTAGVKSYPTWEFADGSRVTGEQTFSELAEKSGCAVPVEA